MSALATTLSLRFSPLPNQVSTLHLHLRPKPTAQISPRRSRSLVAFSAVPATDRLVSAAAYALPFLNSLHYSRFLLARFPLLTSSLSASGLLGLAAAYRRVPYAGFAAFFALYLGVARNAAVFSRFSRFNAMQAVVLDVLLALPALALRLLVSSSGHVAPRGLAFSAMELTYGAVFSLAAACFAYALACSVLGRTPYIPVVAAAAERQM